MKSELQKLREKATQGLAELKKEMEQKYKIEVNYYLRLLFFDNNEITFRLILSQLLSKILKSISNICLTD